MEKPFSSKAPCRSDSAAECARSTNTLLEKYKIGTIAYETALENMSDPAVVQQLNMEMGKTGSAKNFPPPPKPDNNSNNKGGYSHASH